MKLIRYHLPTIVKHVLVPKNDLGIPKITFGNWEDPIPPLPFGKNSQKIPFFLLGGVPYITKSFEDFSICPNENLKLAELELK